MSRRSSIRAKHAALAPELLEVSLTAPSAAERSKANARTTCEADRRSYPFGASPCRILRPSRSVMQAGWGRVRAWVLEFELSGSRWIEPLMGWTATDDPFAQIRLTFPTLAAAVDYAERSGLAYSVDEPAADRSKPRVRIHPEEIANGEKRLEFFPEFVSNGTVSGMQKQKLKHRKE